MSVIADRCPHLQINVVDKNEERIKTAENERELKEKEQTNSCVEGLFRSSVNCRVLIDEVLYEIEEIVFDGQIISYSERIRDLRSEIKDLENEKSRLNEDFVFAKDKEDTSLLEKSKEDIAEDIAKID